MSQVQRVMVGVDFSDDSDASLAEALKIAVLHDAELYVVHVIDDRPDDHLSNPAVAYRKEIEAALWERAAEAAASLYPDYPRERVHCSVRTGRPAKEILAAAAEHDVSVITIGHRGKGFFERTLLGSVASRLVSRSELPVVVTRGSDDHHARCVLAAVNLQGDSERIIRVASDWAKKTNAPLHILYSWEVAGLADSYTAIAGMPGREVDHTAIEDGQACLQALCVDVLGENHDAILHVCAGLAVREIVSTAHRTKASLVVLGSHGRTGLSKMLLGNTAEQVVERAPCSVLVLRV